MRRSALLICFGLGILWLLAMLEAQAQAQVQAQPERLSARRAIRGAPVELGNESDELKAMREFEESSFPRPGAVAAVPAATSPAAAAMPWLSELRLPDLPIRLDERVVRYLEFYRSDRRGRAVMASWLRRQGRFRALIEESLRRAKLPLALLYQSMVESSYDPLDRSTAGAVGLWQFMPDGARIYGLRVDYWVDERRDPERATAAAMRYLADLKNRFGAWPLALAAFNAGYGAVLSAMQKYNTNDYWELCKHEDGLPWETVLYVPKVMAAALVGENRARFGFDSVVPEAGFDFERARVESSTSLGALGEAAGVPREQLFALNPELRRGRTPPEPWMVRLPRAAGARFAAAFERHREKVKAVTVRFGERLEEVARAYGLTTSELRQLNGVEDASEVRAGLTLLVPEANNVAPPAGPATEADLVLCAVPNKHETIAGRRRVFYRTLPHDSLKEIAVFFKVSPAELSRWNALDLDANLAPGMVLEIWVADDFDASLAVLVDPARVRLVTTGSNEFFDLVEARRGRKRLLHTVKRDEDLQQVAHKFGLTIGDLERINRFGAAHTQLRPGQKLVVYVPMTAAEKARALDALAREHPNGPDVASRGPLELGDVNRSLPRPPPPDGRP